VDVNGTGLHGLRSDAIVTAGLWSLNTVIDASREIASQK
jgi:hypothetical protein